jgi:hypothetical protein
LRPIFISYRRDDAEGQAGRLFNDLAKQFGDDAVFIDVAGIQPGRDFRRAIDEHVASCGVLLAIIGKNWLTAKNESGARRLDGHRQLNIVKAVFRCSQLFRDVSKLLKMRGLLRTKTPERASKSVKLTVPAHTHFGLGLRSLELPLVSDLAVSNSPPHLTSLS